MVENIFDKFNSMIDVEGLKQDIATAASSDGEFERTPHGDYEVRITKLELGETGEKSKTPGMPMAKVTFDIVSENCNGKKIFMNQMLTTGFGIHKMNEFLNSLETGIEVSFENFTQYGELINQIFKAVDGVAEFQLTYAANNKGYDTYTIVQRFKN